MATEQIVYDARVEGADETARGFQKIRAELQRLFDVMQWQGKEALIPNLSDSINWLAPALKKAEAAGISFGHELDNMAAKVKENAAAARTHAEVMKRVETGLAKYRDTTKETSKAVERKVHHISEYRDVMEKASRATQKTEKATKKTGGAFGWSTGKMAKFAGAIGLGVYSMYSLASAVRRGFRAVVDFVRGGIELALKKHKEFANVIHNNVNKKLNELKTTLGEAVLPALSKLSVAIGGLLDDFKKTGTIEKFGKVLGGILEHAVPLAEGILESIKGIVDALDWLAEKEAEVKKWAKEQPEVPGVGRIETMPEREPYKLYHIKTPGEIRKEGEEETKLAKRAEAEVAREKDKGNFKRAYMWRYGKTEEQAEAAYYDYKQGRDVDLTIEKEYKEKKPKKKEEYYGPFGRVPALAEMEVYTKGRETEFARETKGWERREELTGLAKGLKKKAAKIREEVDAEALKKATARADVAAAHTKMMTQGMVNAVRSGDVGGAFTNLAINFATKIATDLAAALVRQKVLGALIPGLPIPGYQETGHIPSHISAMPVIVHGGEFILKEAQLKALQAGYGIEGGRAGSEYKIPPAPAPVVEVHVGPGVDADIQTAYRARAGEAQLAQLEG